VIDVTTHKAQNSNYFPFRTPIHL